MHKMPNPVRKYCHSKTVAGSESIRFDNSATIVGIPNAPPASVVLDVRLDIKVSLLYPPNLLYVDG